MSDDFSKRDAKQFFDDFELGNEEEREYQTLAIRELKRAINEFGDSVGSQLKALQIVHIGVGGGKTKVANEVIIWLFRKNPSARILWLAPKWTLLHQAACDLKARSNEQLRSSMFRIGGDNDVLSFFSSRAKSPSIQYTTPHSFCKAKARVMAKFDLVIRDEVHWGESKKMYREIERHTRGALHIGLTGTPHANSADRLIVSEPIARLIQSGHVMRPTFIHQQTGIKWKPEFDERFHEFNEKSRNELARKPARDSVIVDEYSRNKAKYGKTIVFAINIEHAERLVKAFRSKGGLGARVAVVHCDVDKKKRKELVARFRAGDIDVLVNVQTLLLGFDVPETKTVFLTRPTASAGLYVQMVGRAIRKHPAKRDCYIVEFVDDLQRHREHLVDSAAAFDNQVAGGSDDDRSSSVNRRSRAKEWTEEDYSLGGEFENYTWDDSNPNGLKLKINPGQAFGVEIELSSDDFDKCLEKEKAWSVRAKAIRDRLNEAIGQSKVSQKIEFCIDEDAAYDQFRIVKDGSCGWEIISPKLKGKDGFDDIRKVLVALGEDFLSKHGLKVNAATGLHVHLAFRYPEPQALKNLLHSIRYLEPYVATLVAPSRIVEHLGNFEYNRRSANDYCVTWCHSVDRNWIESIKSTNEFATRMKNLRLPGREADDSARYMSVNFMNLIEESKKNQRLEVRLHQGTTNAKKVLFWISLWMQILEKAPRHELAMTAAPAVREVPRPRREHFDRVTAALRRFLSHSNADESFYDYMRTRVEELRPNWLNALGPSIEPKDTKRVFEGPVTELSLDEQGVVAEALIRSNKLSISKDELVRRFGENLLFVRFDKNSSVLLSSAALKVPSPKILEDAKLAASRRLERRQERRDHSGLNTPTRILIKNIDDYRIAEFGWLFRNEQDPPEHLERLESMVFQAFQKKFREKATLFATARTDNLRADRHLKKIGLEPILDTASPWSDQILKFYVWRGPKKIANAG